MYRGRESALYDETNEAHNFLLQLEMLLKEMLKAHGQLLVKEKALWNRWRIMFVGKVRRFKEGKEE